LSLVEGQAYRVRFYQKLFVNEPLDPDIVLQMIADEARRLTHTAMAAVYLRQGEELVIIY
jgi:hypothetical protein